MAEYIDRSVAIARITALEVTEPNATMEDVRRVLADIPATGVTRVWHGEWIPISDGEGAECSECGEYYDVEGNYDMESFKRFCRFYRHCPACGTKMDGGTEDDATYTIYSEMIDEDEVKDGSTVKLPMEER